MILKLSRAFGGAAGKLLAEPFFLITLAATAMVSLLSSLHFSAIHWNVIAILFSQMLVCQAFDECQVLSALAERTLCAFSTPRKLGLAMVLVTGALAMLVTNDVALLTVVPLTVKMAKLTDKDPYVLVILETISANIFSALTPFGNPQNLYLYAYYKISAAEFFAVMVPFFVIGVGLLILAALLFSRGEGYCIVKRKPEIKNKRLLACACAVFVLNILTVLRVADYRVCLAVTMLVFVFLAPRLFKKVDYILLLTFVLFFLFADGVTSITAVKSLFAVLLSSKYLVMGVSALASQIISNVPAAVLISGFTGCYRELIYGVSAGGLGTLIASLASLISYKLYVRDYKVGKYLRLFSALNFTMLALLMAGLGIYINITS